MIGLNDCRFIGRLVDNVALKTDENGKNYCYFDVAIPRGKTTDKQGNTVERPPLYLKFSANGTYAVTLANFGKKGKMVYVGGELSPSRRVVEKDGTKTVYNDVTIKLNKLIFLSYDNDQKASSSDNAQVAEEAAAAAPSIPVECEVPISPADDFVIPEEEEVLQEAPSSPANKLPF